MFIKNKLLFSFIISFILIFISGFISFAAEKPAGKADLIIGKVNILRAEKIIAAQTGTAVYHNDEIQTLKDSRISIKLINGELIEVKENTKINLKTLINQSLKTRSNRFWELFQKIIKTQKNDYAVSACMGVRGAIDEQAANNSIEQIDRLITGEKDPAKRLKYMLIKAELYSSLGDFKQAREMYNQVLKNDSNNIYSSEIQGTLDLMDSFENIPIAILNFSGSDKEKNNTITNILTGDLSKSRKVRLIERTQIDKIIKEYELSESGITKNTIKIGQLTGAQYIITGGYNELNRKIIINARLISVKTGEIIKGWSSEGEASDIFFLSHQIAGLIHTDLTGRDIPGQEMTVKFEKPSDFEELKNVMIYIGFDRDGIPPKYKSGDSMKVYFKIEGIKERKYFITILNIGTDGEVNLLFPNKASSNSEVTTGRIYSIPDDKKKYNLEVYGSPGKNIIIGIVTEGPLNWAELIKIDKNLYPLISTTPDTYLDRGVRLKTEESGIKKWKIGKVHFITEK